MASKRPIARPPYHAVSDFVLYALTSLFLAKHPGGIRGPDPGGSLVWQAQHALRMDAMAAMEKARDSYYRACVESDDAEHAIETKSGKSNHSLSRPSNLRFLARNKLKNEHMLHVNRCKCDPRGGSAQQTQYYCTSAAEILQFERNPKPFSIWLSGG